MLFLPITSIFFGGGQCPCPVINCPMQVPCQSSLLPHSYPEIQKPCSKKTRSKRESNGIVMINQEKEEENKCNNKELQSIMLDNMSDNVKESKNVILRNIENYFNLSFNIICAHGDFSFLTTTRLYCLVSKENLNCYSYLSEYGNSFDSTEIENKKYK
ncbi:Ground-like domain-containing protein [Strongyloides ratti]|uniref:Ground-like domain-containing protein n=1 Tax=Strongyloides ratti TaxID=34506 RepID=A0A090MZ43_STRRB|nr:Ground-like domain-containing protein [Strongyloides ratti]CEF68284.1 Ground-like domain-containing protein [Strongyloides ratti]